MSRLLGWRKALQGVYPPQGLQQGRNATTLPQLWIEREGQYPLQNAQNIGFQISLLRGFLPGVQGKAFVQTTKLPKDTFGRLFSKFTKLSILSCASRTNFTHNHQITIGIGNRKLEVDTLDDLGAQVRQLAL